MTEEKEGQEYKCKSTIDPDKEYIIFFSKTKLEYFCNCKASLFMKYRIYETLKERQRRYLKYGCNHILACKIYRALKNQ